MPGPRQKGRHRGEVENAAAMPREAVDEGEREFGQSPYIQIDHAELLAEAERGGRAAQPEACIIDSGSPARARAPPVRRRSTSPPSRRSRSANSTTGRGRPFRRDLVGERIEPVLATSHQHQLVTVCGERSAPARRRCPAGAGIESVRASRGWPTAADPLPQRDALLRRNAKEVGGAPQQIIFQLVALDRPHRRSATSSR